MQPSLSKTWNLGWLLLPLFLLSQYSYAAVNCEYSPSGSPFNIQDYPALAQCPNIFCSEEAGNCCTLSDNGSEKFCSCAFPQQTLETNHTPYSSAAHNGGSCPDSIDDVIPVGSGGGDDGDDGGGEGEGDEIKEPCDYNDPDRPDECRDEERLCKDLSPYTETIVFQSIRNTHYVEYGCLDGCAYKPQTGYEQCINTESGGNVGFPLACQIKFNSLNRVCNPAGEGLKSFSPPKVAGGTICEFNCDQDPTPGDGNPDSQVDPPTGTGSGGSNVSTDTSSSSTTEVISGGGGGSGGDTTINNNNTVNNTTEVNFDDSRIVNAINTQTNSINQRLEGLTTDVPNNYADSIVNQLETVSENSYQTVDDHIESIEGQGEDGYFNVSTSLDDTFEDLVPTVQACSPFTFSLPVVNQTVSFSCQYAVKVKDVLGYVMYILTLYFLFDLLVTPIKNK